MLSVGVWVLGFSSASRGSRASRATSSPSTQPASARRRDCQAAAGELPRCGRASRGSRGESTRPAELIDVGHADDVSATPQLPVEPLLRRKEATSPSAPLAEQDDPGSPAPAELGAIGRALAREPERRTTRNDQRQAKALRACPGHDEVRLLVRLRPLLDGNSQPLRQLKRWAWSSGHRRLPQCQSTTSMETPLMPRREISWDKVRSRTNTNDIRRPSRFELQAGRNRLGAARDQVVRVARRGSAPAFR